MSSFNLCLSEKNNLFRGNNLCPCEYNLLIDIIIYIVGNMLQWCKQQTEHRTMNSCHTAIILSNGTRKRLISLTHQQL